MIKLILPLLLCGAASATAQPALTIYNQNFATVRESIALDLKQGINEVSFKEATSQVEPDSVMLRDLKGGKSLTIFEQTYRADPVSVGLMLSLNEGKEIDFFIKGDSGKPDRTVKGLIIRSGNDGSQRHGYHSRGMPVELLQPIIQVDGQLQFSLPGEPRFPALADDTILKPTLSWKLHAEQATKTEAEIAYVTGGMSWEAAYNVLAPIHGDLLNFAGWVTMENQTGKTFTDAKVQLVAGEVMKIQPNQARNRSEGVSMAMSDMSMLKSAPQVTEKSFDEYHLYSLPLATTLHDRETKQVEFVRAAGVKAERIYVYDGLKVDPNRWGSYDMSQIRNNQEYGTESNPKVWVMREFKNTKANQLGMPLPHGKVRFYRQDDEGQTQFVGENLIDHTATDETVRIYTGNAFDIVGERKRANLQADTNNKWLDETFEIKLRNRKKEAVEVCVVEHLYRWTNWSIREKSNDYVKKDAQTVEFRVNLKPDEERTIAYTVHYAW
jgi:hypothetical protein